MFVVLAVVNLIALAGSWGFNVYYRETMNADWEAAGWFKYLYVQFHLAAENVLATWYSSTMLFGAGLGSLLCAVIDRESGGRRDWLSYGWLILGAIFILLSADEVGSIHERVGMMPEMNLFGSEELGWSKVLAVPIGIVAVFMAAFGWLRVRRSPWAFGLLVLAVGLYVINPVLERVQMGLLDNYQGAQSQFEHDVSLHLEEGAEIFGALCFLAMSWRYLLDALARRGGELRLVVPRTAVYGALAVFFAVLLAAWFWMQDYGFSNIAADDGRPENWYPSALAILIALSVDVLRRELRDSESETTRGLRFVAAYFWLSAAYYGIYGKGWVSGDASEGMTLLDWVGIAQFIGALAVTLLLWSRLRDTLERAGLMSWLPLLAIGLTTGWDELVDFFEVVAFAVLLVAIARRLVAEDQAPASAQGLSRNAARG